MVGTTWAVCDRQAGRTATLCKLISLNCKPFKHSLNNHNLTKSTGIKYQALCI